MVAYVIGRMRVHSRDWMDEYFAHVPDLITAHKGKFIARTNVVERLEGTEEVPDATYILEFPTKGDALAFWHSDEFAPFIKLRQSGSDLEAMLVEGIDEVNTF